MGFSRLKFGLLAVLILVTSTGLAPVVSAENKVSPGLSITPVRQEFTIDAGTREVAHINVTNGFDRDIVVDLAVKKFSVSDVNYDLNFSDTTDDWISPNKTSIALAVGESREASFVINVPKRTAPGGYYYALAASTRLGGGGEATAQVMSLLYMTVSGDVIRTGVMQRDSVPRFVYGSVFPYTFDVRDTGNVYFSANFYGKIKTLWGSVVSQSSAGHVLFPGITRNIKGEVPAPLLPGIYKFSYGYNVDFADMTIEQTKYVIYLPLWSLIALVAVLIGLGQLVKHRRHRR